ncbi:hypothetical protein KUH32_10735 [Thalassococcus sp. CAU 1522]|uniref:Uncharacterized protein n=1 Tax=Thalassococcus arenae TaxID=2851652 RepID=A0ABS6N8C5_9RHOB|nr:hypothetical protein [Thalassococcus arenae]MBV2360252.1 hypothetical protein [Thalassococcus arenae]
MTQAQKQAALDALDQAYAYYMPEPKQPARDAANENGPIVPYYQAA